MQNLSFGDAIAAMKQGKRVARAAWNGKGMWLCLVEPYSQLKVIDAVMDALADGATARPFIGMKTADNGFVPWLASQTDMLSDDWSIL